MNSGRPPLSLTEQQIETLTDLLAYHKRLSPEIRQFLITVDERTIEWLRTARPDEVDEIIEGIKLITALRTIFKWTRAIVVTIGVAYLARSHLHDLVAMISSALSAR